MLPLLSCARIVRPADGRRVPVSGGAHERTQAPLKTATVGITLALALAGIRIGIFLGHGLRLLLIFYETVRRELMEADWKVPLLILAISTI